MSSNDMSGRLYKHYKGHIYKVIGFGKSSEDLSICVLYTRHDEPDGITWIRPFTQWFESVENTEGKNVPRFEEIRI